MKECMNAEEEREQRRGWRENGEPLDDKMIPLWVSKVKCFISNKLESDQNCTA